LRGFCFFSFYNGVAFSLLSTQRSFSTDLTQQPSNSTNICFYSEYLNQTRQLLHSFQVSTSAASYAPECFTRCPTLRLEAERLDFMTEQTIACHFEQKAFHFDPALVQHLTVFFHAGSLANSNCRTFFILTSNLHNVGAHFPSLRTILTRFKKHLGPSTLHSSPAERSRHRSCHLLTSLRSPNVRALS
jgi:hypothetical protein